MSEGLRAENISFNAGKKDILRDITVDARPGETTALLGPSGSGKTTLLRLIAGLERPSSGRVLFEGEDVTSVPPYRRGFGMMFQEYALFPHLTVAGNIEFGLRRQRKPAAARQRRVAELLELMGLQGYDKRTIEALSGGEKQRVALARALAPEPRLLLLDEPVGALDRSLRERVLVDLRAILDRLAMPTIVVTHDQREAFGLADRLAVMNEGRIVREGTPQGIYDDPGSEFVARFLGMGNIVPASLDAQGVATTAIGTWTGVRGDAGDVLLLIRNEGAEIVEAEGPGVVSGQVVSGLFEGSTTNVQLDAAGTALEFDLPANVESGQQIHVRAPRAQVVAAGDEPPP